MNELKRWRGLALFLFLIALSFWMTAPAQAQAADLPGNWVVNYYTSSDLSGTPVATVSNVEPNIDWGANAPELTVPADGWSATFSTTGAPLSAGATYTVCVQADDGSRVTVNGATIINQFDPGTPGVTHKGLFTATATNNISVDFVDRGGNAFIFVSITQGDVACDGSNVGGGPPAAVVPGQGPWQVQFYNNTDLSGEPAVVTNQTTPRNDWGTGAPINGINADNFSVRWANTTTLSAGTYRLEVAADDGVRVFFNGTLIIDEFTPAQGRYFTREFSVDTGSYLVVVEYYEAQGTAALWWDFRKVSNQVTGGQGGGAVSGQFGQAYPLVDVSSVPGSQIPVVQSPVTRGVFPATATVNVRLLNVRDFPSTRGSNVIAQVRRGENFQVTARLGDNSWYQINVGGQLGWVFADLVRPRFVENAPIVDPSPPAVTAPTVPQPAAVTANQANLAPTGYELSVTNNLNVRQFPSTSAPLLQRISYQDRAPILGRSADGRWWLVQYRGFVGWVSAAYVILPPDIDLNRVPIVN